MKEPLTRPQLKLTLRCSEGNLATLYSDIDKNYTHDQKRANGRYSSFHPRPIDIFRCSQSSCNCKSLDLKTQQDLIRFQDDMRDGRLFAARELKYEYCENQCQYASYTDFVRQINYKIQNINIEGYNKVYQKKIEMYNRIISFVEIERDWLQTKMDKKDLSLYLTKQEYNLFNRLKSGEKIIEFEDMHYVADRLNKSSKQYFHERSYQILSDIIKNEDIIQKILGSIREDSSWEKTQREQKKQNWKLNKDIQDPQILEFDQRWDEVIMKTQENKLCKNQFVNFLVDEKEKQIPSLNLSQITSLQLNYLHYYYLRQQNPNDLPMIDSFSNVKNVELNIVRVKAQQLQKVLWFNNLNSFKVHVQEQKIEQNCFIELWRVIRSNQNLQVLALNLFADSKNIEILGQDLQLPQLQQLDLSQNFIEIDVGLIFCQNFNNLRYLRLNNMNGINKIKRQQKNYLKEESEYQPKEVKYDKIIDIHRKERENMIRWQQPRQVTALFHRLNAKKQDLLKQCRSSIVKQKQVQMQKESIKSQNKFAPLKTLTSLSSLHISNNDLGSTDITNICLFCPPQLISLNISYNPIEDRGIAMIIETFLFLKSLFVSSCKITDKGFQAIALSPLQLTTFASRNNEVSEESISILLSSKPTLEHLDIQNIRLLTQITRDEFSDYQEQDWDGNIIRTRVRRLEQIVTERCSRGLIGIDKKVPELKSLLTQVESPSGIYYLAKLKKLQELKVTERKKIDYRVIMKVMLNTMGTKSGVSMRGYLSCQEKRSMSGRNLVLLEEIKKKQKKRIAK